MQPALRDPNPPLTRSVEDYLKAIYHLSSQGGFAATSDIAAMAEVSPPSVSGMVKRLLGNGVDRACTVPRRAAHLAGPAGGASNDSPAPHSGALSHTAPGLRLGRCCTPKRSGSSNAVSDELIERMASALGQPHTIHTVIPFHGGG